MIKFACRECGAKLSAQEWQIGKRLRCPGCKRPVAVPGFTEGAGPAEIPDQVESDDPWPDAAPVAQLATEAAEDFPAVQDRAVWTPGLALLPERRFGALRFIAGVLMWVGILCVLCGVTVAIFSFFTSDDPGAGAPFGLAVLLGSLLYALFCFAHAELILIMVHIEGNTRTASNAVISASRR